MKQIVIVTPDLFDTMGGIARISRATVLALSNIVRHSSTRVAVHVLRDSGGKWDRRYFTAAGEYRAHSGNRFALTRAVLRQVYACPDALVVFCHVNLAAVSLLFPPRTQRIIVAHGIEVWHRLPRYRRMALRRADGVLAVSAYTREQLLKIHRVETEKTVVLYNCLDPFFNNGSSRHARFYDGPPFFMCVSRLDVTDVYKGVDLLIRAFARVAPLVPRWRLKIVGSGSDRSRLQTLANRYTAGDRIDFVGGVDDDELQRLYGDCKAFVMPSQKEGFGLAFLEAMNAGKPVIAAAAGGAPEVVTHGVNGLLIDEMEIDKLGEAIRLIAEDASLREMLGAAGHRRCRSEFTFSLYESHMRTALERFFGRRKAGTLDSSLPTTGTQ